MALSWTLDKIGPMCRSAEDCGYVLEVIAGADHADPGSAGKSFYYTPQYARDMKLVTIGFAPADFEVLAEEGARAGFAEALRASRSVGVEASEIALPDFPYSADDGDDHRV